MFVEFRPVAQTADAAAFIQRARPAGEP